MDKCRVEQALANVREYLGPFATMDSLPPLERANVVMKLGQFGWERILGELEYLDVNLPSDDSRRPALKVQIGMVRKTLGR